MGLISSLRKQLDRPVWEWMRFAPQVSSSLGCSTAPQNGNFHVQHGRYIYYLINATNFWRYDTWSDTYLQLSTPPTAPSTWSSMRFLSSYGFEGRVLGATSGSMTIPAYFGQTLKGYDVSIVGGTGAGQRRVISSVADALVADSGVPTSVFNGATTWSLSDSTKSWTPNQWAGYQQPSSILTRPSIPKRRFVHRQSLVSTFRQRLDPSRSTRSKVLSRPSTRTGRRLLTQRPDFALPAVPLCSWEATARLALYSGTTLFRTRGTQSPSSRVDCFHQRQQPTDPSNAVMKRQRPGIEDSRPAARPPR